VTAARRLALASVAVVAALLLPSWWPAAVGADEFGSWEWHVEVANVGTSLVVSGTVSSESKTSWIDPYRIRDVSLAFRPAGDPSDQCPNGNAGPADLSGGGGEGGDRDTVAFSFAVAPACNGAWDLTLTSSAQRGEAGFTESQSTHVAPDQPVALAAPPVGSVAATLDDDDRRVTVSWDPPAGYDEAPPPDFVGYRVRRIDAAGNVDEVDASVSPADTSAIDSGLPSAGGDVRYEVTALRTGASADQLVESAPTSSEAVTVAPVPGATTPPTSASTPDTQANRPPFTVNRSNSSSVTSSDPFRVLREIGPGGDGDEAIAPGDEPEPGEAEAVEPENELAGGSVLQRFDDSGSPFEDRTVVVPVAGGMVLLSWALHLRFVARQASQLLPAVPNVSPARRPRADSLG
jgi:hypothetical protein